MLLIMLPIWCMNMNNYILSTGYPLHYPSASDSILEFWRCINSFTYLLYLKYLFRFQLNNYSELYQRL